MHTSNTDRQPDSPWLQFLCPQNESHIIMKQSEARQFRVPRADLISSVYNTLNLPGVVTWRCYTGGCHAVPKIAIQEGNEP